MQLISSAAFGLGHGGMIPKVMGIIAAAVAVYIQTNGVAQESFTRLWMLLPKDDGHLKCLIGFRHVIQLQQEL
jgi:PiT family inorganic phosphate transporter